MLQPSSIYNSSDMHAVHKVETEKEISPIVNEGERKRFQYEFRLNFLNKTNQCARAMRV